MRRFRTALGNVFIWIFVILSFSGNTLLDKFSTASANVEYDNNMKTASYQTEVSVGGDNTYLVKETIRVDMLTERHGIYRYVPMKGYVEDVSGNRVPYYAEVEVLDANVPVDTDTDNGFFVMRLGDGDRTVYGEQTYELSYKLTPKFQTEAFTTVYYNLFPISWQNEIPAGSSFTVTFPKSFAHEKLSLVYGEYGEAKGAGELLDMSWSGDTLHATLKKTLPFLNGVTMFMDMGEGYFDSIHTIGRGVDWMLLVVSLAVLALIAVLFFLFGRDEPLVPSIQYQPPQGLDSAAVGYIIDGSAEDRDILSLILYWADKGYLRIEEEEKDKLFLIKTDKPLPEDAPGYARTFYNRIFRKGKDRVEVGKLKYKCASTIASCKSQVGDYVKAKGGLYTTASRVSRGVSLLLAMVPITVFVITLGDLSKMGTGQVIFLIADWLLMVTGICILAYLVDTWYARTGRARKTRTVLGIILLFAGIAGILGNYLAQRASGKVFDFLIPLLAAVLSTVGSVSLAVFMKKRTEAATEWMGRLAGLRDFIETAELERLKAMAEESPELFYHILPFAYVFGLSDVFAKKLEGLAVPAPEWFVSYDPGYRYWNYYYFNRIMMHNMETMKNTLTIAEPSKDTGSGSGGISGGSFGGGGGFSGGGFGGGGGGSW